MSDFKSKLPDLKELGAITGKLFKDLKTSVNEIVKDYKEKREQPPEENKEAAPVPEEKPVSKKAEASAETIAVKKTKEPAVKITPEAEAPVKPKPAKPVDTDNEKK